MQFLPKAMKYGSAAIVLAGLLGAASLAGAAIDSKKPADQAAKAPSGGGSHAAAGGGSHAAAGASSHAAGGGGMGSHTTTTTTHTTTTTTHTTTTNGMHPTGGATNMTTGGGGTTTRGPTTGGTHNASDDWEHRGGTTGGATTRGPTAGGAESHGITANGGGSHTINTGGMHANDGGITHGASTTTGIHTTAGAGGGSHAGEGMGSGSHAGGAMGAGTHTIGGQGGGFHGPSGDNHSAFKGSPASRGSNEHITRSGGAVRMRPNGGVSDVHDARRGMDVHHGLGGGRTVSMERADHSRIFAEHGRPGYVERPYGFHGHDYERRSYFYHGRSYDRFYRGYAYRGLHLNVYAPGHYYRPAFYGWAYNPWARPISYGWGWGGTPWYGRYGYYFQPYPVYPSAAFWLTDYIISQDLQAAYAAHQEAGEEDGYQTAEGGQPVLTPEVKQMIADEVKNQLELENQEAQQNAQQQEADPGSSGIARLLSDGRPHVFVAGGNLDVTDASGNECVVSDGDTLQLRDAPPSDATSANLVVLSSKGRPECRISLTVQIQLTDLQEMQNHMRETIDQGLQDLQSKQGTGGLPSAPASAQAEPAPAQYAASAPPPDSNVGAEIQQQDQQGEQAERDVTAEAPQDNSGAANTASAGPATVELGQTTEQVQGALGLPSKVANLGSRVIYYYDGMKVTFQDGKVSDVQ